ncbi:MAG TPA: glycosyltransferase [Candidatus Paceibacterota bacterium]|nr:glycosyltransferase [Candidatus Paceibacterota bacterium]
MKRSIFDQVGLWFLFFLVVYVILLIKITTGSYLNENVFFAIYSVSITLYIFSRFLLAYLHKPVPADLSFEPTVTFVVPAKNEEDNIYKTLERFAEVEYPPEKIEVIAINDGSTDRTLAEMERAARDIAPYAHRVEIVNFEVNRGKRYGMAEGIKRATNDIVIFVDSDSFVEKSSVRHLVKYFSIPEVGAVSGHTDVYNRDENTLTRMQALRYYIAFKVYKAAESVFGNVTCCPGCCSAYRRSYLLEFVDEWLHQTFFGAECTFGDDRSLTNFMIREHQAAYSYEARAYTVVPNTFRKYMKQQQRWKKSWIRETFIASTFIWKKNPFFAAFFYGYVFLAFAAPIVFVHALIWNPIFYRLLPWVYLSGLFLMLMLHGIYYRLHVGKRPWFFAVVTFWFYSVILMWQLPWALVTIADTRWGTR